MSNVILATAGYDHTIRFWEAPTGVCYRTIQFAESQINKLEITPDARSILVAGNPHLKLFDVASSNPSPISNFEGHSSNVTSIGFPKTGKWFFSGSEDGTVRVWDTRSPSSKREYEVGSPVNSVVLHPNQMELIVATQSGKIGVCDLSSHKFRVICSDLTPVPIALRSVTITADGRVLVAANNEGKCFVYAISSQDTSKIQLVQELAAHKGYILTALFSPDMRTLATTSADKTIALWSLTLNEAGKPHLVHSKKSLVGHERWVWDCRFSADSAYLVSASSDQTTKLWELSNAEVLRQYSGHSKAVVSVALRDY
ncbi:MAG: WD40 repeat domain-containing protein [archaeon]|nr:WD40 repeat domain-containing protein [archaeon]